MDNQTSLEYIIENEEFIDRFATALGNSSLAVKKQVFEILAAICVYSKEGYARTLQVLEKFKTSRNKKYRFSLLLDELRATDNAAYKINVLELINCLIIYTEKLQDRARIRNEFFGLRLQEVLSALKKDGDPNALVQVQLFEEHQSNDEEILPGASGIDLSCPLDVFHAVHKQVCDTPYELQFLTVLQHFLKIDLANEALSTAVWEAVEQLVNKATVLETPGDAAKLLTSITRRMEGQRHRTGRGSNPCSPTSEHPPSAIGTPPPPAPPVMGVPPPPPPPFGGPPAPPPAPGAPKPPGSGVAATLPQQNTPKPRAKMKKLQWQKIPVINILNKNNLWTKVGKLFLNYKVDYHKMDELFALPTENDPKGTGSVPDGTPEGKRKKENTEINLLDGKRSLNVNIFLKQFRMSHEDIVRLLKEGHSDKFGAERLKGLLKQLPSQEEIDLLKGFDGDRDKLGNVERFFLCLMALPNFRMRIEGLLIREEFNSNLEWIRPSIEAVIQAAKDIKENKSLQELIFLILITGNYLNSGNQAGNAAGFKLSSLLKLTEIRANKPRMNLLHYVVLEAEEKNPRLLRFPDEMQFLKDASQVSLETLTTDVKSLSSRIKAITTQIAVAGEDFQKQMAAFLKEANLEILELEEDLKDIDGLRKDLSVFFSEDASSFQLEECFKIWQTFCERFKKAIEENQQRKLMEERAELKRRQKEAELKRNSKANSDSSTLERSASPEEEGSIVDMLLADVRSGYCNRKYTEGNFNVTKVQKISLNSNGLASALSSGTGDALTSGAENSESKSFVRGGYGRVSRRKKRVESGDSSKLSDSSLDGSLDSIGSDSLMQKRSRKSYATEDDDSLIEFLMESGLDKDASNPDLSFDRYASMRRRRQERRKARPSLDVVNGERERAPSPLINGDVQPLSTPTTPTVRSKEPSPLRRTRSWLDRPSVSSAGPQNDPDALVNRIKRKLHGDREQRTPPIPEESSAHVTADAVTSGRSSARDTPHSRGELSRWRSNITNGNDHHHHHEGISEKRTAPSLQASTDKNLQGVHTVPNINVSQADSVPNGSAPHEVPEPNDGVSQVESSLERSRRQMKQRYSSNVDTAQLSRLLGNDEFQTSAKSHDDSNVTVSVSMRKAMSDKIGTNLDGLLKTIEDSDRPIDNFGVISPHKRSQTETVTAMVSEESSRDEAAAGEPTELKQKREKRKKRSTLDMDDVRSALRDVPTSADDENSAPSSQGHGSPRTPPSKRRPLSSAEHSPDVDKSKQSKEEKAAAKQAAKKNFRDARFGYKSMRSTAEINGRCRSNVERQEVDRALKDLMGNMSRSKSYDESVARQTHNEMSTMRNSGSDPNTANEKRSLLRGNSINRLSLDGRRNGLYIPSDESDTELRAEDKSGSRRPSSTKSDSPKSVSRLSVKSANTSTETLRGEKDSDGDSSPEQQRRKLIQEGEAFERSSKRPSSATSSKAEKPVRRSYSHLDSSAVENAVSRLRNKVEQLGDTEDNPLASVAKWRLKRTKRLSAADNDSDSSSPSPRNRLLVDQVPAAAQHLLNDIGSRSSYASSTDTDQGFESMGTVSQRTSLSSTLEGEAVGTPILGRKADNVQRGGQQNGDLTDQSGSSLRLEHDSRTQRTRTWTEETLRVSAEQDDPDTSQTMVLSPDSGHSASKEDVWSEAGSPSRSKTSKSPKDISKSSARPVPSYMRSTNSSTRSRATPSPSPLDTSSSFRRDAASRKSFRAKESPLIRDVTVRASMRAESALRRDAPGRTSVRGPRASVRESPSSTTPSPSSSKFLLPPGSRARADSNVSAVSSISSTSILSASSKGRTSAESADSPRPTTPFSRRTSTPSKGLTRTQSMRVSSTRTSAGTTGSLGKQITTPNAEEKRSLTPLSHDVKRPTTPSSDISTTSRRQSHLMDATAASKAHLDTSSSSALSPDPTPVPPSRNKSRFMQPTAASTAHKDTAPSPKPPPRNKPGPGGEANILGSLARHGSLRITKTSPRLTSSELSRGDNAGKTGSVLSKLTSSKKIAPAEMNPHLATVAEHAGAETEGGSPSKDKSLLCRMGIGKDKDVTSSTPTKKTVLVTSAQARAEQEKKKVMT